MAKSNILLNGKADHVTKSSVSKIRTLVQWLVTLTMTNTSWCKPIEFSPFCVSISHPAFTIEAPPLAHMGTHLPYGHTLRRSQSSLHTARRCIPNVPTYISNDHEHQNGTINSSLVGVIIGDWKFYNHQGLCFNSKRSIRVGLMDITCGLMISQDRNLIRLFVTCIVLTDWTNMAIHY
ncbi:hypothetical protein H8356DRAFT_1336737 [Neocallimastix lanati (nom. inval.)]|nr:hypothetical protein H8356DRAFT_1336737 [Neocallimastix sp. JGI-2020a]